MRKTYVTILQIVQDAEINNAVGNVLALGENYHSYTLLLALYSHNEFSLNNPKIIKILKLMEIILFKVRCLDRSTRSNYFVKYAKKLKEDNYSLEDLISTLTEVAKNGFQEYWKMDEEFTNKFKQENPFKCYKEIDSNYLLYKYENYLRAEKQQYQELTLLDSKNLKINKNHNLFSSLDHIYPQKSKLSFNFNGSEEENYLHDIGVTYCHSHFLPILLMVITFLILNKVIC